MLPERQTETGFLPSESVYFKRMATPIHSQENQEQSYIKNPSRINIGNIENLILFSQEVPITEPESVKRKLQRSRNFDTSHLKRK